ncbi:transcription factor 24-like [Actinia tenebrosa]|uniref:Transcription factor 24-like n=1 Tax=Actinia tenebrosa TaxID=6105 RepID=A0A6P8I3W6_ACTTE|nr:transcription factor 24-like [Actinia tenebrosa]
MGRYTNYDANENQLGPEEFIIKPRKRANYDHPSANALRERIRAQNLKKAYMELQKTLPNVPPDTKLPRLNILLLAIDHIEHLMTVLSQETSMANERLPRKEDMIQPFIKKWPARCQLFSEQPAAQPTEYLPSCMYETRYPQSYC